MPRPSHEPTDERRAVVEAMSAAGISQEAIASTLKLDPKTLRLHYRDELDNASTRLTARMAENLVNKAMGDGQGAVTATIFWLKTRAGWKEPPQSLEHSGPDGSPIQTEDVTPADALDRKLARLAAAAQADSVPEEPDT